MQTRHIAFNTTVSLDLLQAASWRPLWRTTMALAHARLLHALRVAVHHAVTMKCTHRQASCRMQGKVLDAGTFAKGMRGKAAHAVETITLVDKERGSANMVCSALCCF